MFLLSPKWDKQGVFGPQIKFFELVYKSGHELFLKLYQMKGITKWLKWVFRILKENLYPVQNVVNKWSVRAGALL